MNIRKKQIRYNRSVRREKIQYIVIHDTGNRAVGANAQAHFNYFDSGDRGSSADIFIDEKECLIVNDFDRYYTWHVGDGKGRYGITNRNAVGIELCINRDGDFQKTFDHAVEYTRQLMKELDIPASRVVRHYDASRKNCPQSFNVDSWAYWKTFQKQIQSQEELTMKQYEELKKELQKLTETLQVLAEELYELKRPMIYNYIDQNMPEWAREAVQWAVKTGVLKGNEQGFCLDDRDLRYITFLYRMQKKQ